MTLTKLIVWLLLLLIGNPGYAQSPCEECLTASQEELKHCLDNAISQEDKISCGDKQDAQAKICENSECKTERAESRKQGEVPADKKQSPER